MAFHNVCSIYIPTNVWDCFIFASITSFYFFTHLVNQEMPFYSFNMCMFGYVGVWVSLPHMFVDLGTTVVLAYLFLAF